MIIIPNSSLSTCVTSVSAQAGEDSVLLWKGDFFFGSWKAVLALVSCPRVLKRRLEGEIQPWKCRRRPVSLLGLSDFPRQLH